MKINYINNYYLPSRPVSAVQSTRYNRGRGLGGRGGRRSGARRSTKSDPVSKTSKFSTIFLIREKLRRGGPFIVRRSHREPSVFSYHTTLLHSLRKLFHIIKTSIWPTFAQKVNIVFFHFYFNSLFMT